MKIDIITTDTIALEHYIPNRIEKETIDEIIFKSSNPRNRLLIELMARGGMRIGEVLKVKPSDVEDRKIVLHNPKSGRDAELVFIPQKNS